MRSRISSSSRVTCEAVRSSLTQLGQPASASRSMPPAEQDGAGSALSVVAALLGAGEPEPLAQRIQQRRPRINNKRMCCSIHPQGDFKVHRKRVSFGGSSLLLVIQAASHLQHWHEKV